METHSSQTMSTLVKTASLAQIYQSDGKMYSVCRKYAIQKNSYLEELYITVNDITAEYTNAGNTVFISVKNVKKNWNTDEDIDTKLRKAIQTDKLEKYDFSCVIYYNILQTSVINRYIK